MLGTRNATVSGLYNTCFLLDTPNIKLMVDAGGGNGVLGQLKKVGVGIADYHTEEKTIATRKATYTQEAAENFKGRIVVPDDFKVIEL